MVWRLSKQADSQMKQFLALSFYAILTMTIPMITDSYGLFCLMDSFLHLFVCLYIASITKAEVKVCARIAEFMCGFLVLKVMFGNPYVTDFQFYAGWMGLIIIAYIHVRDYIKAKR